MGVYTGISGNIVLDQRADREPDFRISDMDPATGKFWKIADIRSEENGTRVSTYMCNITFYFVNNGRVYN